MRETILVLLSLIGCTPADSDVASSAGDDTAAGEELAIDYSHWTGTRDFEFHGSAFPGCVDSVTETAEELLDGPYMDAMRPDCATCDHFYEVVPDVPTICDGRVTMIFPVYRAIGPGKVVGFMYMSDPARADYDSELVDDGDGAFRYTYEQQSADGSFTVEGAIQFERGRARPRVDTRGDRCPTGGMEAEDLDGEALLEGLPRARLPLLPPGWSAYPDHQGSRSGSGNAPILGPPNRPTR